jgi:hypothetical protein
MCDNKSSLCHGEAPGQDGHEKHVEERAFDEHLEKSATFINSCEDSRQYVPYYRETPAAKLGSASGSRTFASAGPGQAEKVLTRCSLVHTH